PAPPQVRSSMLPFRKKCRRSRSYCRSEQFQEPRFSSANVESLWRPQSCERFLCPLKTLALKWPGFLSDLYHFLHLAIAMDGNIAAREQCSLCACGERTAQRVH